MGKGEQTKIRILELAEKAILANGFAGTSIEGLIEEAGITKGGFFYHFKDKTHLIECLMQRYIENDNIFFDTLFNRADDLVEDPLQQYLLFLKLFAEAMSELPSTHPGCIIASVCYANKSYAQGVADLNKEGMETWRQLFHIRLQNIAQIYPVRTEIDLKKVADALIAILEGAFVLTRVYQDKNILPDQILLHRDYVKYLFHSHN